MRRILHRRHPEEFLHDLVVRTRRQIAGPLRVHVVDAIETDHAFDVGGNGGVGVVAISRRVLVAGKRYERGEMGARGIADEADAIRVEIEFGSLCADELDRSLGVVNRGRIGAGFTQPVVDGENRIAGAGEEQTPISVELPVANLPAAAVDCHQHRRLGAAFGQIEIAEEFGPVVLGKNES